MLAWWHARGYRVRSFVLSRSRLSNSQDNTSISLLHGTVYPKDRKKALSEPVFGFPVRPERFATPGVRGTWGSDIRLPKTSLSNVVPILLYILVLPLRGQIQFLLRRPHGLLQSYFTIIPG